MVRSSTRVEGPGNRFALWVQGCALQCIGCFNPQFFSFEGGEEQSTNDLTETLLQALDDNSNIEGITLLGGEPFGQARACFEFASVAASLGMSVVTFSGYTLSAIRKQKLPYWMELLSVTDVLVAGPFVQSKLDRGRPWLGSTNQKYHFLTDRYSLLDFDEPDGVEIEVRNDGKVSLNGWARNSQLDSLLDGISSPQRLDERLR